MKIEIESLKGHFKKVSVEVPADHLSNSLDNHYRSIQQNVTLKGFRKGKAPMSMIKELYRDNAVARATQDIVEEALRQAMRENSLTPVASPQIDVEAVKEGTPLKFTATFENLPPVEIKKYTGLKLKKEAVKVESAEIEKTIDNIRNQFATLEDAGPDATLKAGLVAHMDYAATHEGQPFEAATEKDAMLEIGIGALFADFETAILGMHAGQSKDFTVKFPKTGKDEEATPVAGKTIEFSVLVKGLKTKKMPELDADFCKKLGGFESAEDLRKRISQDIEGQKSQEQRRAQQDQVVKWLIDENPVEAPETMVSNQMQQLAMDAGMQLSQMGLTQEQIEVRLKEWGDEMFERSTRQVKASLLLSAIAKKENIQASEEDIRQEVVRMALQSKRTPKDVLEDLQKRGFMTGLYRQLTEVKALQWILEKATGADG